MIVSVSGKLLYWDREITRPRLTCHPTLSFVILIIFKSPEKHYRSIKAMLVEAYL